MPGATRGELSLKECELAGSVATLGGLVRGADGQAYYHARTAEGLTIGPLPEMLCQLAVKALDALGTPRAERQQPKECAWFDARGQPRAGLGEATDVEPYEKLAEHVLQPILDRYAGGITLVPAGALRQLPIRHPPSAQARLRSARAAWQGC